MKQLLFLERNCDSSPNLIQNFYIITGISILKNAHFAYVSSIVYASCHLFSLTIHYVFESILNRIRDLTKRIFIESSDHLNIVLQINFDTNVQNIYPIQINYIQNTYFTRTCKKC